MKINQPANSPNNVTSQAATGNRQCPTRAQTNDAPASAAVTGSANSTSPLATQVRQLQSQLTQPGSGDFNAAKVAEIRQAISAGRYQINTGKIADGLLDTVRDLQESVGLRESKLLQPILPKSDRLLTKPAAR